jgi:hypothetical protein
MQINRSGIAVVLCLVLGAFALAAGCGPTVLSPPEQAKVDEAIKQARGALHKDMNADRAKQQAVVQQRESASRKGARRGQ